MVTKSLALRVHMMVFFKNFICDLSSQMSQVLDVGWLNS